VGMILLAVTPAVLSVLLFALTLHLRPRPAR
jgi:hypothetical protein